MTTHIFPTIETMQAVNNAIEAAQEREHNDDHLTEAERENLVVNFEAVFGTNSLGYHVEFDLEARYLYIIFEWDS